MEYTEVEIDEKIAYLVPISDLHLGDVGFTKKSENKLRGYINWVMERDNARIVLNGDIFNTATRMSKTSPFEQLGDEEEKALNLFYPVKDKIVAAIEGNHEARLINYANFSITKSFCRKLDIFYGGYSCVINFKVWKRERKEGSKGGVWGQQYLCYTHHTTGGGNTVGGKMNRIEKLESLVTGCDFYMGSHNHQLGVIPLVTYSPNLRSKKKNKIEKKVQYLIDTGGYLEWDGGYPEKMMLRPTKLGSPRIRLDGMKRDIHVSI